MKYLPVQPLIAFAAVLAGVAMLLAPTAPSVDAGSAQVTFSPATASIAVDGTVDIDLTVASVNNLGGYDVFIQFDPAIVQMTSLTDTGFVTNSDNIVVCNTPAIDNAAGTATNSCATIPIIGPPGPGVSAGSPTALMNMSFLAVGDGKSALTLSGTELLDPDGTPIGATLGSGSITVSGVGGVTELPGDDLAPSQANGAGAGGDRTALLVLVAILAPALAAGGLLVWRRARAS